MKHTQSERSYLEPHAKQRQIYSVMEALSNKLEHSYVEMENKKESKGYHNSLIKANQRHLGKLKNFYYFSCFVSYYLNLKNLIGIATL